MAHSILMWTGDILHDYAFAAMMLLGVVWLRRGGPGGSFFWAFFVPTAFGAAASAWFWNPGGVIGGAVAGVAGAVLVAAPGVVQVREVELVDGLVLDQLQQRGQVVGVALGHRVAHADLDAALAAQADAVHRGLEGALLAAEVVVRGADAVEADADVVEADLVDQIGRASCRERVSSPV